MTTPTGLARNWKAIAERVPEDTKNLMTIVSMPIIGSDKKSNSSKVIIER